MKISFIIDPQKSTEENLREFARQLKAQYNRYVDAAARDSQNQSTLKAARFEEGNARIKRNPRKAGRAVAWTVYDGDHELRGKFKNRVSAELFIKENAGVGMYLVPPPKPPSQYDVSTLARAHDRYEKRNADIFWTISNSKGAV